MSVEVTRSSAQGSVGVRVLVAMLTVASGSGVVKLASMAKEMTVAATFGAGDQIDAFVIASVFPTFFIGIVAAAFQSAVIPTFIQVREDDGPDVAREFISTVAIWTCVVLAALMALLVIAAPVLLSVLGSGFDAQKLSLTRRLLFLQAPLVVLTGLSTVWGAAMNAEGHFALVAITPIATPLAVCVVILTAAPSIGIFALPAGLIVGALVENGVVGYAAWKRRIWMAPRFRSAHPAARIVMTQAAAMAAGAMLMNSAAVVDNAMAAMLPAGSVATLNYGNRLVSLLLGLSSGALSTAILPQLSTLVAQSDLTGVRQIVRNCVRWILIVAVPLTVVLILFSEPIIRLTFQRGAFTSATTMTVSNVQVLSLLQVPFYLTSIVMVRLISALKANHLLAWGSAINLAVNVGLNYVFMQWIGISGIALSTTAVYVVSCTFLAVMAARRMRTHGAAARVAADALCAVADRAGA